MKELSLFSTIDDIEDMKAVLKDYFFLSLIPEKTSDIMYILEDTFSECIDHINIGMPYVSSDEGFTWYRNALYLNCILTALYTFTYLSSLDQTWPTFWEVYQRQLNISDFVKGDIEEEKDKKQILSERKNGIYSKLKAINKRNNAIGYFEEMSELHNQNLYELNALSTPFLSDFRMKLFLLFHTNNWISEDKNLYKWTPSPNHGKKTAYKSEHMTANPSKGVISGINGLIHCEYQLSSRAYDELRKSFVDFLIGIISIRDVLIPKATSAEEQSPADLLLTNYAFERIFCYTPIMEFFKAISEKGPLTQDHIDMITAKLLVYAKDPIVTGRNIIYRSNAAGIPEPTSNYVTLFFAAFCISMYNSYSGDIKRIATVLQEFVNSNEAFSGLFTPIDPPSNHVIKETVSSAFTGKNSWWLHSLGQILYTNIYDKERLRMPVLTRSDIPLLLDFNTVFFLSRQDVDKEIKRKIIAYEYHFHSLKELRHINTMRSPQE